MDQAAQRSVEWTIIKSFDKVIERHNGYKQTIRVSVSKSSHHKPNYSFTVGVISADGQQLHRNIGVGYTVSESGSNVIDESVDAVLDLIEEASEWIEKQIKSQLRGDR